MDDSSQRPRLRHRLTHPPQWVRITLSLALAATVGLAAFAGFARASFVVGPGRVSIALAPSLSGSTEVALPPFGAITGHTHVAPLAVRFALLEVDLPQLEELAVTGIPDQSVIDGLVTDLRRGANRAVWIGLSAALVAAGFVGWALRHRWRLVVSSALVGAIVPGVLVAWTVAGFQPAAFENAQFRGAVSYAPSLIALVERRVASVGTLRGQIGKLTKDLASYYAAPQSFASAGSLDGTYRVLHISDVHLDPVGLQLAEDLARDFDASLIVDTGDINHYGSDVEAGVLSSMLSTDVPRVYVPGNHDSPAVIDALAAIPGVTVIGEPGTVIVDGLRLFGVPDPGARTTAVEPEGEGYAELGRVQADALRASIESGEPTPTIVLVHAPRVGEAFEGLTPLVLSGHTHTPELEQRGGTWFLNSGTTGGIHFSELRNDPHIPHGASVLYFTENLPRRLVAIDRIEVYGIAGQSSLSRTIVAEELLDQ